MGGAVDVKPFLFEKLPKVSRQELRIIEALRSYWPRIGFSDQLRRSIKGLLMRELGSSFSLKQEKISTVPLLQTLKNLSPEGVYITFGRHPLPQKAVLDLDPYLAPMMIDKLLGGTGEAPASHRPLTEIESGILSYLALKIFSLIFEKCGRSARVHFRLDGVQSSTDRMMESCDQGEKGVEVIFRVSMNKRAGYARLILPSPFIDEARLDPMHDASVAEFTERDTEYYAARLSNFEFLETDLWVELGRTHLKAQEVNGLESGDVILLEKTQARMEGGRLGGQLSVRMGRGEKGSFRGTIVSGEGPIRVFLDGVDLEQPVT